MRAVAAGGRPATEDSEGWDGQAVSHSHDITVTRTGSIPMRAWEDPRCLDAGRKRGGRGDDESEWGVSTSQRSQWETRREQRGNGHPPVAPCVIQDSGARARGMGITDASACGPWGASRYVRIRSGLLSRSSGALFSTRGASCILGDSRTKLTANEVRGVHRTPGLTSSCARPSRACPARTPPSARCQGR